VPALAIVEDLDIFKDCCLGLRAGLEVLPVHQLLFQRRKLAFHRRIF
jgi:hypothetical protein|tara:strand:- start:793 stop:933 length:141 start_codon:yes stop_codon:yes gene_type:complete